MRENRQVSLVLPTNWLLISPVVIIALLLSYIVLYREISILLVISTITIAVLYLRERHPSFLGLIIHLTIMFSIPLLISDNIVNTLVSLFLALSLLNYVVGFISLYKVGVSVTTWPATLLVMSYSGFIGILLSFLNIRILYQALSIIIITVVLSMYRYFVLNRNVRVDNRLRVAAISGETIKVLLSIYNSTSIRLYYSLNYDKNIGLKIKSLGDNIVVGGENKIPLEIIADEPGVYNLRLKILFEDNYRLTKISKETLIEAKIAPKTKIALLAAHRLLARLPREIIEQAPGRKPSNIVFNPRLHVSRRGEYYGARQYVPGDDLSQIHWKKSLSKLTLISKERKQSYSPSIIILADTSSHDNRDYANILYSLISTLISFSLQDPLRLVSIAVYDLNNVYIMVFEEYVAKILYKIIKMIEEGRISRTNVPQKILDKSIANILASSSNEKISVLYEYLISSLREKYVWKIILRITEASSSHNIMFIHGENVVSDMYLLIGTILSRKGYMIQRPPRIPPRILYEKVLEEPIGVRQ